jgi:aminoglycoside/choline kinase family phosphotransferase
LLPKEAIIFIEETIQDQLISIVAIHNSGSNRQYYRIFTKNASYIITDSKNIEENQSFFYFSKVFKANDFLVPNLIAVHPNQEYYLQEDIGNQSLLDNLLNNNFNLITLEFYKKSIDNLAQLQLFSKENLDFNQCYDFKIFDEKVVWNDLFYFKKYFLDKIDIPYKKSNLIDDFQKITSKINHFKKDYFLYRDFQARNIYIYQNQPYFIDFQGGMQGFLGYDLVSLLWQAKANLPLNWKEELKNRYFNIFNKANEIKQEELQSQYETSLILRFYQLLGAYGLRGLVEKKSHFLESILHHLENLDYLLQNNLLLEYPELERVTQFFVSSEGKNLIKNIVKNASN